MHFLGLSGMPRRIPDYPDVYYTLNSICSFGSLLSLLGIFAFFVMWYVSVFPARSVSIYLADIVETKTPLISDINGVGNLINSSQESEKKDLGLLPISFFRGKNAYLYRMLRRILKKKLFLVPQGA